MIVDYHGREITLFCPFDGDEIQPYQSTHAVFCPTCQRDWDWQGNGAMPFDWAKNATRDGLCKKYGLVKKEDLNAAT